MTAEQYMGAAIMGAVILGLITATAVAGGWRLALGAWSAAIALTALITLGNYLMTGELS